MNFSVYLNSPHIGDMLILNGNTYTIVLKVKGLDAKLKQVEMKVGFDYNVITPNKIITSGCTVSTPIIYHIKEIAIIHQFEIKKQSYLKGQCWKYVKTSLKKFY